MPILEIVKYPNKYLKSVAKQIDTFDDSIHALAHDMLETMYKNDGIGLAANQVSVLKRLIVVDVSSSMDASICMANPEIISSNEQIECEEGCLSFPGIFAKVKRFQEIEVEYFDLFGVKQKISATDMQAICIQHEIDHLNGITFYDHLSSLKQKLLRKKLKFSEKTS